MVINISKTIEFCLYFSLYCAKTYKTHQRLYIINILFQYKDVYGVYWSTNTHFDYRQRDGAVWWSPPPPPTVTESVFGVQQHGATVVDHHHSSPRWMQCALCPQSRLVIRSVAISKRLFEFCCCFTFRHRVFSVFIS